MANGVYYLQTGVQARRQIGWTPRSMAVSLCKVVQKTYFQMHKYFKV